jgi:hypothetical protein
LFYAEHSVIAKQERPSLDSVSVRVFGLPCANLPEDNPCAVFAFADVATAFDGLLVGKPIGRAVAIAGQQKDVQTTIGTAA